MSVDLAHRILQALSHMMGCPFKGCTCSAGPDAARLYAEASRVVRETQTVIPKPR
jgi:hypothetical protein